MTTTSPPSVFRPIKYTNITTLGNFLALALDPTNFNSYIVFRLDWITMNADGSAGGKPGGYGELGEHVREIRTGHRRAPETIIIRYH